MWINETRTRVHAPLERVLGFLEDPRRLPAYSEKARRVEVIAEAPELLRVSGHVGPQAFTTELMVSRNPASGFAFECVEGGPFVRGELSVSREDGFTILTHREEWRFVRGWTERIWVPSLRAMAFREAERIKRQVEWALIDELLHWRAEETVFRITWLEAAELEKSGAGPKAGS